MGMKLTSDDLREIASTVDKIQQVGLNVHEVEVRGHKVMLKRTDSQMEGLQYYVLGVTSGEFAAKEKVVMRDEARKPDTSGLAGGRRR